VSILTSRWTTLKYHPVQAAYWNSPHRFNVVPAGRRSGKTELAKRKVVKNALKGTKFDNPRFFCAAPTVAQAKRIYWQDLKAMVPRDLMSRDPYESDLIIPLITGAELHVLGMDKPERIEGSPWDGGILDEYGNMKEGAWSENVRPALADRNGWCDLIGVPEGRNHYYDKDLQAKAEMALRGSESEWGSFSWFSADILPAAEIEAARRDMHPKVFQQEYEGSFVDFSGVSIFAEESLLVDGSPVPIPPLLDAVFATVDTSIKGGKEHDGTAVVYWGVSQQIGHPLVILDWDIVMFEGSMLETWLMTVFENLQELARRTKVRAGSIGAYIEDANVGTILLQNARNKGWPAQACPSKLTSLGKDARAIGVSGKVYQGKVKFTQPAYDKVVNFKEKTQNHLLRQVTTFHVGDKDAATRADDLLDCFCYGVAVALGDPEGF
jgi:hypothetical protein